jgi:hypothetical protein
MSTTLNVHGIIHILEFIHFTPSCCSTEYTVVSPDTYLPVLVGYYCTEYLLTTNYVHSGPKLLYVRVPVLLTSRKYE